MTLTQELVLVGLNSLLIFLAAVLEDEPPAVFASQRPRVSYRERKPRHRC
jgi:hypothetical protein